MNHHSRLFGVTVSMLFTGIFVLSSASQCGLGSALVYAQEMTIVDDSFEDFSKGTLSDGGHNLYVASEGSIRTINRFDLNQDGYLDVIFNCTHNTYQMLPATVGHIEKDRTATDRPISVEGSQQVAAADLNRDGWADLVFCPNPIGVHHDRRFLSVAWGGPDGWVSERINSPLPMNSVVGVEIVDLNGDGWPDIAALGGSRWLPNQPEGRIIRIYLGSATGYSIVDVRDLGVVNARAIAAGDFDGNNARDLAVLRSDGKITIVWGEFSTDTNWNPARSDIELSFQDASCLAAADLNVDGRVDLVISRSSGLIGIVESKSDRTWNPVKDIPAFNATQITVADLDRDQKPELVLTQFDQARAAGGEQAGAGKSAQDLVRILWNESGTFSRDRITELAVPFSVATAAGDLDGDGNPDLVVAVHQGKTSFSSESQVWFGNGKREFTRSPSGFKTSGTLHVVVVPAEKRSAEPASTTEARELPARAVFCNSIGGELDENVPLHIFWGGKEGFDPERIWKLPFHSGYEASASDLNTDGFVDLIVLNSGHAGEHSHTDPTLGANIVWGGPEGIDKSPKRTVLKEHFLGTSSVSDLNRDGWLDLVLEPFAADPPGSKEKLFVYYGGRDGYSLDRRIALELDGYSQEHLVADFNHDNWLDIAVTTRSLDCIRILWGGEQGFSTTREQRLKISGPVGVDAADFNGDGWLDILGGSYSDPLSGHRDMGLVIFWGSADGYTHSNAQWLPGFSPLGRTVADFDADGFLDLVSPQHSGELTREDLACHIYWGSDTGFATRRRTTFFSDSVNDTMAGDFNGDGRIDLAVNGHTRHGDHRARSQILYNDGKRFENPRIQRLPANGPHLIWAQDVGNIYDRKYRESYESRIVSFDRSMKSGMIRVGVKQATGSRLALQIRSGRDELSLRSEKWRAVKTNSFDLNSQDRVFQYRVEFHSDNGDRYPVLEKVEIEMK